MAKIQYHSVSVLYGSRTYDCTNGGLSSKHERFLVALSDADGEALKRERADDHPTPILVLEQHVPGAIRVRPLKSEQSKWVMFGGNYAKGDSSFGEAVAKLLGTRVRMYDPVAIHDRVE